MKRGLRGRQAEDPTTRRGRLVAQAAGVGPATCKKSAANIPLTVRAHPQHSCVWSRVLKRAYVC